MKSLARRTALAAAALTLSAAPAHALPGAPLKLLVNTSPASLLVYDDIHVGGPYWTGLTSSLLGSFGSMTVVPDLTDLNAMLQYDALWVDQRYQSAPLDVELTNLVAFANTGRRVVVMGENVTWGPWNAAILGAFGGAEGAGHDQLWYWMNGPGIGCQSGQAHAIGANPLLAGVSTLNMACAGYAVGGTQLFDYNVATLWGPQQNVLTVLDANVFDDRFIWGGDGAAFRSNVMTWASDPSASNRLATTTPEPATVALLATGLITLGIAARRRRVS